MSTSTKALPTGRSETALLGHVVITLTLEQSIPPEAETLIWNEFFASRNRGIDWKTHLPWAKKGQVLCISAYNSSRIIATTLMRYLPDFNVVMVGYVCVHKNYRGKGLTGKLIEMAAKALTSSGFSQLILWTRSPRVYKNSGFVISECEEIYTLKIQPARLNCKIFLAPWPEKQGAMVGLPPFAIAGWRAEAEGTSIVFVDTAIGATLLESQGRSPSINKIMSMTRPGTWLATLDSKHDFAVYANNNDLVVEKSRGPATMVRPLVGVANLDINVPLIARI